MIMQKMFKTLAVLLIWGCFNTQQPIAGEGSGHHMIKMLQSIGYPIPYQRMLVLDRIIKSEESSYYLTNAEAFVLDHEVLVIKRNGNARYFYSFQFDESLECVTRNVMSWKQGISHLLNQSVIGIIFIDKAVEQF
jgi:hypothetical protein